MSRVFKSLPPIFTNVTHHVANKRWLISDSDASTYGVKLFQGEYITGSFNTIDDVTAPIEATTTDGEYKHLIHRSINNLYYRSPKDISGYETTDNGFCFRDGQYQELHQNITVISIPSSIFGDRIKPGSFSITSGSTIIRDDGSGNLYDSTTSRTHIDVSESLLYIGFNEGYQYQNSSKVVNLNPLDNVSKYKVVPRAYRVKFGLPESTSHGTYAIFDGTGSYSNDFTLDDPTDNQFVEVLNSEDFDFEKDFAITFKIRLTANQVTTSSYEGGFEADTDPPSEAIVDGLSTSIRRTLVTNTDNVIVTKREFDNQHIPFEIAVGNTSGTANRKIIIRRKSRNNGQLLEQTIGTALAQNTWYSIILQKTGSNLQYVQQTIGGVLNQAISDVAHNQPLTTPTNIHIAGRPYGYKNKYYDTGIGDWVENKRNRNIIRPFKGDISEFRIFDSAIPSQATSSFFVTESAINNVGNIFYEHGIATITTPTGSNFPTGHYHNIFTDGYNLDFRGSKEVVENLYICNLLDSEFNVTQNPTIIEPASSSLGTVSASFTEDENFNPYITTIGLYNDSNELLAIGKLAQPIQKPIDYDITFMIRFDT